MAILVVSIRTDENEHVAGHVSENEATPDESRDSHDLLSADCRTEISHHEQISLLSVGYLSSVIGLTDLPSVARSHVNRLFSINYH